MPTTIPLFFLIVVLALAFGFLLVIPIGAADMPVVISLLNSYAGLADASMGFVLMNKIQIITGSLDGTSGFLLSLLMCRRSEEHTSELQSRLHLVCRLLLEKKKS